MAGWFDQNAPPTNTQGNPAPPQQAGANEQQLLQQAMAAVGVTGTQMRNDPGAQQRVQQYLASNGSPGWQFGGTKAGDWVQTPSGQQMDFLNSHGDTFQWVPDPANPSGTGSDLASTGRVPPGGSQSNLYLPNDLDAGFTQQFHAPTAEQARQTPGYDFLFHEGQRAVQSGAAAKGTLLTGGTMKALAGWGQGLADTTYQQTYQNAMNEYLNAFNIFNSNQGNLFNRLNTISQQGQSAANNSGNILMGEGNTQAAGQAGQANAWGTAVSGLAEDVPYLGATGLSRSSYYPSQMAA